MIMPKVITIIGANGIMGINISGLLATYGQAKVYMACRSLDKAKLAANKAVEVIKSDSRCVNIIPVTYDELEDCIRQSDWIIESVAEEYRIKQNINKLINESAKEDAIISTGTSSLSVKVLSQEFSKDLKKRYMGIHFFNPPSKISFCEIIPTEETDRGLVREVTEYLERKILRNVIEVVDQPAFLANRIGFYFLNEALQYASEYQELGGIDYIDSIFGPFTGRNMSPLRTLDFVGLDIHKAITENVLRGIDDYARGSFQIPQFLNELINSGNIGIKSGKGLYKIGIDANGSKRTYTYDITTQEYRHIREYSFQFKGKMISLIKNACYKEAFQVLIEDTSRESKICLTLLLKYVLYALYICRENQDGYKAADIAMAYGFGWIPPQAIVNILGGNDKFKCLCYEMLDMELINKIDIETLIGKEITCEIDYRSFLRALG